MRRDGGIELEGVIVVLSAHLDDAVFSLGAAISCAARGGADVTVLTVLAGDPRSTAGPSAWDSACGYGSAAAAAAARRREDAEACRRVGAAPVWFPFDDGSYGRSETDEEIWRAIEPRLSGADTVMVPGFPLSHPDHAWLARLALGRPTRSRIGLYLEQPYAYHDRDSVPSRVPDPIVGRVGSLAWRPLRAARRDRRAKRRAIAEYRSQLRSLSRRPFLTTRLSMYERRRGEAAAWIGARTR